MIELDENKIQFVIDKTKLKNNFETYQNLAQVHYPLKTNSMEYVVKELNNLGCHFLISSLGHLQKIKDYKIDINKVCNMNVLLDIETLKTFYDNGVRFFTFDNFELLKEFSKFADLSQTKILIRLSSMELAKDTICHMGASLNEVNLMIDFLNKFNANFGLSFYLQQDISSRENILQNMLNFICDNFKNKNIRLINIGGINQNMHNLSQNLENFKKIMQINEINLEIGNLLVGNAVNLKTKIIRKTSVKNQNFVVIKNGIYSGFMDKLLFDKKFKFSLVCNDKLIKLSHQKNKDLDYNFYLFGGSSDSKDLIASLYISLKDSELLKTGATILVEEVGAYFEEVFTNYCNDLVKEYIEV